MENLYYLPIFLVENVLFEKPENSITIEFMDGSIIQLDFTNTELEKYYKHYYIEMQEQAKGVEVDDSYKIPIGIEFYGEKAILLSFEDFKKEFDKTHLSRIDGIILNVDGEEKEFFVVQLERELLEEVIFNQEEVSLDLGKWNIKISTLLLPVIISSLSPQDKKAILVYEQKEKGEELELFGLLLEPDFDNPERTQLTLKKI